MRKTDQNIHIVHSYTAVEALFSAESSDRMYLTLEGLQSYETHRTCCIVCLNEKVLYVSVELVCIDDGVASKQAWKPEVEGQYLIQGDGWA